MIVWRIAKPAYRALDGEGARLFGGRWNSEGVPVVYTSGTLSLAALEYLVHLDMEDAPPVLVALEIEVPDDSVDEVPLAALPRDWNQVEEHPTCVHLGDRWVSEGRSAVLRVPSAVIPHEANYLLNPLHEGAGRIRTVAAHDLAFDRRLLH